MIDKDVISVWVQSVCRRLLCATIPCILSLLEAARARLLSHRMAKTTALESTRVFFASISSLFHDPGCVHFSISDLLQTLEALRLIIIATYRLL